MTHRFSLIAFFAACLLIVVATCMKSKGLKERDQTTISWDVMGYYLYLPATFIYKDLAKVEFGEAIVEKYKPSTSFYQVFELDNSNRLLQYPIGLAILNTPFFFIGHFFAGITDFPQDGFSLPYQIAIWWGGILVAFLGLWMLRKLLLQYFTDQTVGITLLVLVFATNYLNYSAIDGALTHNYLFTIYVLLIWVTRCWYLKPNWRDSVFIGLLVGFAALTRPTDILAASIPILWGGGSVFTEFFKSNSTLAKALAKAGFGGNYNRVGWIYPVALLEGL